MLEFMLWYWLPATILAATAMLWAKWDQGPKERVQTLILAVIIVTVAGIIGLPEAMKGG